MYLEQKVVKSFLSALSKSERPNLVEKIFPEHLKLLSEYFNFLYRWNKKINLTRVFSSPEVLCDEFLVAPAFYSSTIPIDKKTVLDIGSGNGIPAVFCSLMHPDKSFVLCEVDYKKAVFLQELKRSMGLPNISVVNSDFKKLQTLDEMGFDVIMFKNVSKQSAFLLKVGQLLAPGGRIVFQTSLGDVDVLRKKNAAFNVVASYNIPVTKKTCLVELSIVPRETM